MGFIDYIKKLRDRYVTGHVKRVKLPYFEPTPVVRKRLIFSGRVQNVGFRLEIYELAKRLDLFGWIKNRNDNKVEAEIQGESEKIAFLIKHMESLKRASVRDVTIKVIPILDNETGFTLISSQRNVKNKIDNQQNE